MIQKRLFMIAIIVLVTFLAYGNTLFNKFVWDDKVFIEGNPYIKNVKYLPALFQKKLSQLSTWGRGFDSYYRPLFLASFMLDYHLWGQNPFYFHLHNVLLHVLCSVLVFYFAREFVNEDRFAFICSLLFSLHPIHTEAVAAVFNRMDVFVTVCFLGSFLSYVAFRKSQDSKFHLYLFSLLLFFVGIFSKEFAVMLPPVLLIYDYFFFEKRLINTVKKRWLYYLGFVAVFLFYMSLRISVLNQFVVGYVQQPMYTSFQETGLGVLPLYIIFQSLFVYFEKLLLPINFNIVYYFILNKPLNFAVFVSIVIVSGCLFYALFFKSKDNKIAFFILWFFITIFPVSQIIPFGNIVAEHYTYLPSVGFCCILGYFLFQFYKRIQKVDVGTLRKSLGLLFILFVCLFYFYQTMLRNYDWRNEFTLWNSSARMNPLSPKPYINLADAYLQIGKEEAAVKEYYRALSLVPYESTALGSLGALYVKQGDPQRGLRLMHAAAKITPEDSLVYRNIGRTYNLLGEYEKAIRYLKLARSLNPGRLELTYDLGLALCNNGHYEEAKKEFLYALSIDSSYAYGYYGLGLVYFKQNKKGAEGYFQKAINLEPNFRFALQALKKKKNYE